MRTNAKKIFPVRKEVQDLFRHIMYSNFNKQGRKRPWIEKEEERER